MKTLQALTPNEAYQMALSFGYVVELSESKKANRDWALAHALDKKADLYFKNGNDSMGKVCRTRALVAANRAASYSK
jgi:hypothetical protein